MQSAAQVIVIRSASRKECVCDASFLLHVSSPSRSRQRAAGDGADGIQALDAGIALDGAKTSDKNAAPD
jgi:hypothetical protein